MLAVEMAGHLRPMSGPKGTLENRAHLPTFASASTRLAEKRLEAIGILATSCEKHLTTFEAHKRLAGNQGFTAATGWGTLGVRYSSLASARRDWKSAFLLMAWARDWPRTSPAKTSLG
jgi:hypothetical protein